MPLSDDGGLVAYFLQQLGEGDLRSVEEGVAVDAKSVEMAILAGEDGGSARSTNRVGHIATVEPDAFVGESIDVGGGVDARAVGAYCLVSMVVGEDE